MKNELPVLFSKNTVLFPGMTTMYFAGKLVSQESVKVALNEDSMIILANEKTSDSNEENDSDVFAWFKTGILAKITDYKVQTDGSYRIKLEGLHRCNIIEVVTGPCQQAFFEQVDPEEDDTDPQALRALFDQYAALTKRYAEDILVKVRSIKTMSILTDTISAMIPFSYDDKVILLQFGTIKERCTFITEFLEKETGQIHGAIEFRDSADGKKFDYDSLGSFRLSDESRGKQVNNEYVRQYEQFKKTLLPRYIEKRIEWELELLKTLNEFSLDSILISRYISYVLSLPWKVVSYDKIDLASAEKILKDRLFGRNRAIGQVYSLIAAIAGKNKHVIPYFCFTGMPGTGKSSMAKALADVLGRKFIRVNLSAVTDNNSFKGIRREYFSAGPGIIMKAIAEAGTSNPLILLDNIENIANNPQWSALLVNLLSPEENTKFFDNYVDETFDLSGAIIVCTSYSRNLPYILAEKLTFVDFPPYTVNEKLEIAKKVLLPKICYDIAGKDVPAWDDSAILSLVNEYYPEAGCKGLIQGIESVMRHIETVKTKENITITRYFLVQTMGVPVPPISKPSIISAGSVNGLVETWYGGEIIYIESSVLPGKGELFVTGNAGNVMKETARIALGFITKLLPDFDLTKLDVYVYAGSSSAKEGPSAGLAIALSLYGALTRKTADNNIAVTGELTLMGNVRGIGGLLNKSIAADKYGICKMIIPVENKEEITEFPEQLRKTLQFIPVSNFKEAVSIVFP